MHAHARGELEMNVFYDKDNAEAYLGAAALALQDALGAAVSMLAKVKGIDDLSWLDELHQETVGSAKTIVLEEVAVDVDAGARKFACEVVDAKFKSVRVSLGQAENDDLPSPRMHALRNLSP